MSVTKLTDDLPRHLGWHVPFRKPFVCSVCSTRTRNEAHLLQEKIALMRTHQIPSPGVTGSWWSWWQWWQYKIEANHHPSCLWCSCSSECWFCVTHHGVVHDLIDGCRQSWRSAQCQSRANQIWVIHCCCVQQSGAVAGFGVHVGHPHSGKWEAKWHVLDGATHWKSFCGYQQNLMWTW